MPANIKEILADALALSARERATLADALLASLDRPDPRIDALWAKEAEDRLAAFEAGEMKAVPADDVSEVVVSRQERLDRLRRARGIWKDRDDLPELSR